MSSQISILKKWYHFYHKGTIINGASEKKKGENKQTQDIARDM
jgi:hypothetical protein